MVDVREEVLPPPHGTTPAAVKANKNKKRVPVRAMKTFISLHVDTLRYIDSSYCWQAMQVHGI